MDNSGMSALTEKGALDLAIAQLQQRVRDRDAEIDRLRAALTEIAESGTGHMQSALREIARAALTPGQ